MGRTVTPTYRVDYTAIGCVMTAAGWDGRRLGKPTEAALARHVAVLNASFAPGGANEHIGRAYPGTRVTAARVVQQRFGTVMATWREPVVTFVDVTPHEPDCRCPRKGCAK